MPSAQKRTADAAIDHIVENIRIGRYAGGQRLVEIDLMEETGIGRGPMREALRILAGDGVVEIVPNKGARVRKLDAADLLSILEVLGAINVMVVGKCAQLATRSGVRREVRQLWKACKAEAARKDEVAWYIAVGVYHEELARLSGNRLLHETYLRVRHVHFHRELVDRFKVRDWAGYVDTYEQITNAILSSDEQEARLLMFRHHDRLVDIVTLGEEPAFY